MDSFVFVVCQQGAEQPLKAQALETGLWRLAFSRPGLLTMKFVGQPNQREDAAAWLRSPLVRLTGTGMGPAKSPLAHEGFQKVWDLALKSAEAGKSAEPTKRTNTQETEPNAIEQSSGAEPTSPENQNAPSFPFDGVHVFERDRALPGAFSFEPGISELARTIGAEFHQWLGQHGVQVPVNSIMPPGSKVLDVIMSEPDQWFVGHHTVRATHEQWPAAVPPVVAPPEMVSRAYLKLAEALLWSRLPMKTGDRVVEIGSAPGGASQRLLDLGYEVTGIDAAEMDERVAEHPRFEHWRNKAAAVKRRLYRKFKWLVCDANVAPNYTLDILHDIVSQEDIKIQGMILTFKLSSWDQLRFLEEQLGVIRSFGFSKVQARQLAHNRRELCVAVQK